MRRSFPLLALAVLAAAALELLALHWMKPFENRLLDSLVKAHAGALAPDPDIVLVDIDEHSLVSMEKRPGAGRGRAWSTPTWSRASRRKSRAPSCST
jgi:CHASE2 domain-containing sensor protein